MMIHVQRQAEYALLDDAQRNHAMWRSEFSYAWQHIGCPFYACVYCGWHHLYPETRPHCTSERMVALIYTFPVLRRDAPGLCPWEPEKWARAWRKGGMQTSGSYHAVAFILSVWAGSNADHWKRRGYSFDMVRALGVWDESQRGAFLKWAQRPWWP